MQQNKDNLVQNVHVRSLIIGYMIGYRFIWLRRLIVSSFKPMIYFTKRKLVAAPRNLADNKIDQIEYCHYLQFIFFFSPVSFGYQDP